MLGGFWEGVIGVGWDGWELEVRVGGRGGREGLLGGR